MSICLLLQIIASLLQHQTLLILSKFTKTKILKFRLIQTTCRNQTISFYRPHGGTVLFYIFWFYNCSCRNNLSHSWHKNHDCFSLISVENSRQITLHVKIQFWKHVMVFRKLKWRKMRWRVCSHLDRAVGKVMELSIDDISVQIWLPLNLFNIQSNPVRTCIYIRVIV